MSQPFQNSGCIYIIVKQKPLKGDLQSQNALWQAHWKKNIQDGGWVEKNVKYCIFNSVLMKKVQNKLKKHCVLCIVLISVLLA